MQTHVVQHAINTSSCSTSCATKASRSRQPSREWDGPPTLEGILHCLSAWAHASCFKQERRPTTRPPCCSQNFPQRSCWTGRGTTSSNPSTCLPSIRSKRHKGLPRQQRTPRPSPSWQETGRRSKATWASGKTAPGGWTSSPAVTRSAATPPPASQASLEPRYFSMLARTCSKTTGTRSHTSSWLFNCLASSSRATRTRRSATGCSSPAT